MRMHLFECINYVILFESFMFIYFFTFFMFQWTLWHIAVILNGTVDIETAIFRVKLDSRYKKNLIMLSLLLLNFVISFWTSILNYFSLDVPRYSEHYEVSGNLLWQRFVAKLGHFCISRENTIFYIDFQYYVKCWQHMRVIREKHVFFSYFHILTCY